MAAKQPYSVLKIIIIVLIPVFLASCLGASMNITVNPNGSGTITQEFRLSLDLFELIMAFEEEYGVEIPPEELEGITTVGEVVALMKSKGV
jgi:hypothetical protein